MTCRKKTDGIQGCKLQCQSDNIEHPSHYGGKDNPYEAIKVIKAHKLNFSLGNAVKYILRAGKKENNAKADDLKKAIWYLIDELNESQEELEQQKFVSKYLGHGEYDPT